MENAIQVFVAAIRNLLNPATGKLLTKRVSGYLASPFAAVSTVCSAAREPVLCSSTPSTFGIPFDSRSSLQDFLPRVASFPLAPKLAVAV